MIETLLFSVLIIAIAMALLLVKVLIKKNGRFSSQHIHDSEAMRERGIHCVIDQDREARNRVTMLQKNKEEKISKEQKQQ